jgi:hypothetical protein
MIAKALSILIQDKKQSAPDEKALSPTLAAKNAAKVGHPQDSVAPSSY